MLQIGAPRITSPMNADAGIYPESENICAPDVQWLILVPIYVVCLQRFPPHSLAAMNNSALTCQNPRASNHVCRAFPWQSADIRPSNRWPSSSRAFAVRAARASCVRAALNEPGAGKLDDGCPESEEKYSEMCN